MESSAGIFLFHPILIEVHVLVGVVALVLSVIRVSVSEFRAWSLAWMPKVCGGDFLSLPVGVDDFWDRDLLYETMLQGLLLHSVLVTGWPLVLLLSETWSILVKTGSFSPTSVGCVA